MKTMFKTIVGTLTAGAMAMASASPAMARDGDGGGIDTGDIVAGALILGGIAAVAIAASDNDDDRYDQRYRAYDNRYDQRYPAYDNRNDWRDQRRSYRGGYQEDAVNMCVRAAEQTLRRYTYGSRAEVTQIRDVDRERRGFEVKGRIAAQDRDRNYRRGGWDEGRFTCQVRRGQVVDIDYNGIRGL